MSPEVLAANYKIFLPLLSGYCPETRFRLVIDEVHKVTVSELTSPFQTSLPHLPTYIPPSPADGLPKWA